MPEHVPFSRTPNPANELQKLKREAAKRNLLMAYKRCFATESGKVVLADLKAAFGFGKWAAKDTAEPDEIVRRELAKGPLYHIEEQINFSASPPRRKKKESSP